MTDLMRAAIGATLTLLLCLGPGLVSAQTPAEEDEPTAAETKAAKQLEKQRAKEARIEEYLRNKEERRVRREMERNRKEQEKADEAAPARAQANAKAETRHAPASLPRDMRRIQELLWEGSLGQDPTVRSYLGLIERGEASPQQIAAFGNFLGEAGMKRAAIAYYGIALQMEKNDALLWLNVGTLHRQVGEYSAASSAYSRSLTVDPNNAFAHYNLGAVMDEMGRYEEAIREYKMALTLDPSLGDPVVNPQAVNNERLLAVQLMLYKEQEGSLGLPLIAIPGGELEPAGADEQPSDE